MEYKKITEVELIEEPSENAAVLAEDNGKLRRVPFKKVSGGSGLPSGGAPHQMLVTDADGKTVWEDRTHYFETFEAFQEGIPETRITQWTPNSGMYMSTFGADIDFVEGQKYKVTFDGTEYVCTGTNAGSGMISFGNISWATGGDDTGEPFLIAKLGSDYAIFVKDDNTHEFKVDVLNEVVVCHNAMSMVVNCGITDGSSVCDVSGLDIIKYANMGLDIKAKVSGVAPLEEKTVFIPLTYIDENLYRAYFSGFVYTNTDRILFGVFVEPDGSFSSLYIDMAQPN